MTLTLQLLAESLYIVNNLSYHNVDHIQSMLKAAKFSMSQYKNIHPIDEQIINMAIWYHDVVYVIGRDDNEQRSALLFELFCEASGNYFFTKGNVQEICELIRYTSRHLETLDVTTLSDSTKIVLDADLSSFADDYVEYQRTTQLIRQENKHLSHTTFMFRRCAFLKTMLAKPTIYLLPINQELLESNARANMQRELEEIYMLLHEDI